MPRWKGYKGEGTPGSFALSQKYVLPSSLNSLGKKHTSWKKVAIESCQCSKPTKYFGERGREGKTPWKKRASSAMELRFLCWCNSSSGIWFRTAGLYRGPHAGTCQLGFSLGKETDGKQGKMLRQRGFPNKHLPASEKTSKSN